MRHPVCEGGGERGEEAGGEATGLPLAPGPTTGAAASNGSVFCELNEKKIVQKCKLASSDRGRLGKQQVGLSYSIIKPAFQLSEHDGKENDAAQGTVIRS